MPEALITPKERAEYLALLKTKLPPDVYNAIRRFVTADPEPPKPRSRPTAKEMLAFM
jgi:hypothetical protein